VIRNSPVAREYFSRFGIRLTKFSPPPLAANCFVDLSTGKRLDFFLPTRPKRSKNTPPSSPSIRSSTMDSNCLVPLPEDLALPFGEFLKKHDLGDIVILTSKLCQGFRDLLAQPTLYVMRNFGTTALQGFANGYLVPDGVDNSELYRRAEAELADSLFLNPCPRADTCRAGQADPSQQAAGHHPSHAG
jgi:hypothetical protein